jgi:hypothetical protein
MTVPFEEREKRFSHLINSMGFKDRIADEVIRHTGGITADLLFGVPCPEGRSATLADLPLKSLRLKIIERILFFEH